MVFVRLIERHDHQQPLEKKPQRKNPRSGFKKKHTASSVPSSAKQTTKGQEELIVKQRDGRLHHLMGEAKTAANWGVILQLVLDDPVEVRGSVLRRFLAECPGQVLRRRLAEAAGLSVGPRGLTGDYRPRPRRDEEAEIVRHVSRKRSSRAEIEGRREKNRAKRLKVQPKRGMGGEKKAPPNEKRQAAKLRKQKQLKRKK